MALRSVLPAVAVSACGNGPARSGAGSSGSAESGTGGKSDGKKKSLASFSTKQEIADFIKANSKRRSRHGADQAAATAAAEASPAPAASPAKSADGKEESVTNNQTAGVDEGGIVKMHGDHMVVLRRGRLFTVRVGGGDLTPVSTVDAFAPGLDGSGAWYDEMLVHDDQVIVIGYSYGRGGAEVGLFDIDREGRLSHRDTYHLRSNDYYSSRNYASRLIGDKLVFYTPLTTDSCKASCVDWYGNARPIFVKGRTFALLGYEIVEGRLESGRMLETRRVSFSPAPIAMR